MRLSLLILVMYWLGPGSVWAQDIRFYEPTVSSPPGTLFGINAEGLTERVRQALADDTGFTNLRSFTVHWTRPTFRCLLTSNELFPEMQNGACLVEVGAFQVTATALIVKKESGFAVSILDAFIE